MLILVQEGAFIYERGMDPYEGDIYHENPLVLMGTLFLIRHLSTFIPFIFILIDLLTGLLLHFFAKSTVEDLVSIFLNIFFN